MIDLLIWVLIMALVFGLVLWVVQLLPLPEPFRMIAIVMVALIFLLIILTRLLPLAHALAVVTLR